MSNTTLFIIFAVLVGAFSMNFDYHYRLRVHPRPTSLPKDTIARVIEGIVDSMANRSNTKPNQSEFAPKDPDELPRQNTEQYIAKYKHIAISEHKRTGVPASITMAQAIIESANGNSRLARQCNNHFGIKCHERTCKPGHCQNYTDDSHKDFFIKFKTVEHGFKKHSAVVLNERYTRRVKNKKSYVQWAKALEGGGYATAKGYANKLIRIIKAYDLDKLDK